MRRREKYFILWFVGNNACETSICKYNSGQFKAHLEEALSFL